MNRLVVFFNDRDTEGTQEGGEWSYRDRDSEGTGVNVGAWWCVPTPSPRRPFTPSVAGPQSGVSPLLPFLVCPRCSPVAPVRNVGAKWCVPVAGVVCRMGLVGARRVRRGQVGYSMIVLIP